MLDSSTTLLSELSAPDDLLITLMEVSLTGIILFQPVYAPDGHTIVDLAYVRLNPAAQRMLDLPEQPSDTFLSLYPSAQDTGIFDFYRTSFETGKPGKYNVNYQDDKLDNYYHLAAQRSDSLLVVSFTDTADQDRSAVEQALRESQARERAAYADAELRREQLNSILMQAPAMICLFEGPEHVFKLVNPLYQQLVGERPLLGMPIAEAMPELVGQPIFDLLDSVYRTGETFQAHEMLVPIDHQNSGGLGENYYNFIYQAMRNLDGAVDGILVLAYEVTAQVQARQGIEQHKAQLQQLNQQLEAANEALLRAADTAEAAQAEAEGQRLRLFTVLEELPASIATYHGPDHVYQMVNPRYQQLFPARQFQGRAIREALPELEERGYFELFDQVYQTGEVFIGQEMEAWVDALNTGQLELRYHNVLLQALRDTQGTISGVLSFSYDVTEQVLARRQAESSRHQVEQLNEELAATNEEMLAANEEIRGNVVELQLTETALIELNNDLESRVAQRTQQVRAAQQEAERQRARLERFFMQAPAAICVLDGPELVYELVNPRYQQLFPGRELQGKPILKALPELAGLPMWQSLRRVYETGITHEEKDMLVPVAPQAGGKLENFYFDYIQQARYNEHGQIDGVLVFSFEVTEQVYTRQRAEALQAEVLANAQRAAQERETFYQVFEQTPACIVLLRGPHHRVEYYNQAYQRLFLGREMRGRTIAEIQPDALAQGFVALLDNVYATGETFYGNELQLLVDQMDDQPPKVNYFNFTYQPYREKGAIVGISVFAYEVSEQVQARQQRERNERQLQLITDALPVLICYLNRDEKYQFANQSYESWFLKKPSELLGLTVRQVVGERAYASIEKYIRRALAGERLDFEARMPYREDFVRYIHTSYVPDVQNGEVVGFYGMIVDITDQVESRHQVEALNEELAAINEELHATNEELLDTNQQLIRTNIDLDNFIYTASHDLRAPIANIEGLLQALTYQLPPSVASEDQVLPILNMMQGAVERFQKTIAHLTDVTKLQKEQLQPTQTVDLAAILREVRLDLAPLMAATQAQLRVEVGECPTISFSQKNLRSVLYNLLSNAFKYCHPGRPPEVLVRCRQNQNYAILEVQDNGLGLDLGQQARLFGMFQRFHDHVEGTGIGLYMVKRMVENAGGRIEIQSQPGEGSTFIVFFPH